MKKSHQHTIDLIFPIALFFVFAATALIVLLFSAGIYQKQVNASETGFGQTTALSYITEKIRQNDTSTAGGIYLGEFDQCQALAIPQIYGENHYTTYIYELDGELKEIFLMDGIEASAQTGTTILEIDGLAMEELSDGLFLFTCTSTDGTSSSTIVSTCSTTH